MATNSLKREAETFYEHEHRLARMPIPEVLERYKRHTWAVTMDVTNDEGEYKTSQVGPRAGCATSSRYSTTTTSGAAIINS